MSEIYGLGIAMPMNYKAMIDQLDRFGSVWQPVQVTIKAPEIDFEINMLGNGKMEISGETEYPNDGLMTPDELDVAMMWAATALLGTLATRGLQVVGLERIAKGSHVEKKRSTVNPYNS